MKFCPKCAVRLKKNNNTSVICPKCGYSESKSKEKEKDKEEDTKFEFTVLESNDNKETLPSIKIDYEKCGNNQAVWWMLQTRSADEPTTQFYRCTKCNHTWRNYA